MTVLVPRWEWRTFGDHLAEVEPALAARSDVTVVESSEVYLLSVSGLDLVKLRAGLMDVKHRLHVDGAGLEQWAPVLKAPFPLSEPDVDAVAAALGISPVRPGAAESLEVLLDDVWGSDPAVRAVDVHKTRHRYRLDGCLAEVTEIRTERGSAHTIAVESEDPGRVIATVRELGLGALPNVNVGRGLKVLERFGAERFAVIDVGTNSVKFHVAARDSEGGWHTVTDRAEVTRLGEGLRETGRLNPGPIARTVDAIEAMTAEATRSSVAAIAAVGTAGLRIAPNGQELVDAVRERCGVRVEVIPGEEEARLAYRAATAGFDTASDPQASRVVFDTGGGSSQFTFGDGARVDEQFSVEVGAARFTEGFGLDGVVSDATLAAALEAIGRDLAVLDGREPPASLVAMGGAVTNLAAVRHGLAAYDAEIVHGTVLGREEIDRQIELYRSRPASERREIVGLQPGRADVILAGACIVRTVLDKLGKDAVLVCDRGLRHGVVAERFR